MLILGLQGSPRKKGNTGFLLDAFLRAAERRGAATRTIQVAERRIEPCREYVVCEKRGTCPIDDDMPREIYGLLRSAEVVVLASPIFFYNMTAQLKALVDRCQTFWARKYRLKLADPLKATRAGFVLSAGATRGKNLFEGLQLTAKYFFDAIDARFAGSLLYRGIEGPKDLARHPTVAEEVERAVDELLLPYAGRTRVLFASRGDDGSGPMAAGFAQSLAGGRLDAASAGSSPAAEFDPEMVKAMREAGIDLAFRRPQALADALGAGAPPEVVVAIGGGAGPELPAAARRLDWDLPETAGMPPAELRRLRDAVRARVEALAAASGP
jgi:multimeric flavodoxin WrbA/protein-tyrosine-phosphatase